MSTEDERAALYRAQQARRVHYQSELWHSLSGPPATFQALMSRWQPVIDYLAEREIVVEPETELDPLGISDTVNVGE